MAGESLITAQGVVPGVSRITVPSESLYGKLYIRRVVHTGGHDTGFPDKLIPEAGQHVGVHSALAVRRGIHSMGWNEVLDSGSWEWWKPGGGVVGIGYRYWRHKVLVPVWAIQIGCGC